MSRKKLAHLTFVDNGGPEINTYGQTTLLHNMICYTRSNELFQGLAALAALNKRYSLIPQPFNFKWHDEMLPPTQSRDRTTDCPTVSPFYKSAVEVLMYRNVDHIVGNSDAQISKG